MTTKRSANDGVVSLDYPCKKFFRSRAHINPLSHNDAFDYPLKPNEMDWSPYFPYYANNSIKNTNGDKKLENTRFPLVNFVDVGCGFGGLTIALSTLFPDKITLGMEIRPKVCEFVKLRCEALRKDHENEEASSSTSTMSSTNDERTSSSHNNNNNNNSVTKGTKYQNVSAYRTNCMRLLPHIFIKGQLEKMFFCFPDPHFKAKNHRRRVISDILLTEYAYYLKEDGILYTITDVKDLHDWHVEKCDAHPLYVRLNNDEMYSKDPAVRAMIEETEEGKKVTRNGGEKFYAIYRRIKEEELPSPIIYSLFD